MRRDLLGDAVHAAAAVREHDARNRDHVATGILRADERGTPRRRTAWPLTGTATKPLPA